AGRIDNTLDGIGWTVAPTEFGTQRMHNIPPIDLPVEMPSIVINTEYGSQSSIPIDLDSQRFYDVEYVSPESLTVERHGTQSATFTPGVLYVDKQNRVIQLNGDAVSQYSDTGFGFEVNDVSIQLLGKIKDIKIHTSIDQDLRFIHKADLRGDRAGGFNISLQSRRVHWPMAAAAARKGYWLAIEKPIELGEGGSLGELPKTVYVDFQGYRQLEVALERGLMTQVFENMLLALFAPVHIGDVYLTSDVSVKLDNIPLGKAQEQPITD
ncbi:MAG: hypothetical protein SVC26_06245, partial [Pseudomonadota bacterium]|nr:hypothetical protein [Pseudomonadota bacterium]